MPRQRTVGFPSAYDARLRSADPVAKIGFSLFKAARATTNARGVAVTPGNAVVTGFTDSRRLPRRTQARRLAGGVEPRHEVQPAGRERSTRSISAARRVIGPKPSRSIPPVTLTSRV